MGETERMRGALKWLVGRDTGASSRAMLCVALDLPHDGSDPLDPSDLGRCLRLLERMPWVRDAFPKIRDISPTWAELIDRWDELTRLYERESLRADGRAPGLYAAMCDITDRHSRLLATHPTPGDSK